MLFLSKHYSISKIESIEELKKIFPKGECDELNFILYSTSGVHGSYTTLQEIDFSFGLPKEHDDYCGDRLTVLVIQPRLVNLLYGHIKVKEEDISYLINLKESSKKAISYYFD